MADEKTEKKEFKLEIRTEDTVANGIYSNFIVANQSETEFTLDFIFVPPQSKVANVRSRIILSPAHTKRLAMLLSNQLKAYEKHFGEIKVRKGPGGKVPGGDPRGSTGGEGGNLIN